MLRGFQRRFRGMLKFRYLYILLAESQDGRGPSAILLALDIDCGQLALFFHRQAALR